MVTQMVKCPADGSYLSLELVEVLRRDGKHSLPCPVEDFSQVSVILYVIGYQRSKIIGLVSGDFF